MKNPIRMEKTWYPLIIAVSLPLIAQTISAQVLLTDDFTVSANSTDPNFEKIMTASMRSSMNEWAYQHKSQIAAARTSKETPQVLVSLTPYGVGIMAISINSTNYVPFRYRYTVSSENGTTICKSPDVLRDVYPDGLPMLVSCSSSVKNLRNEKLKLQVTIVSMPHGNSGEQPDQVQMSLKYNLGADGISLLRID